MSFSLPNNLYNVLTMVEDDGADALTMATCCLGKTRRN